MTRPTLDEYFIGQVRGVATRSTCLRRSVGAIAVDRRGRVLATGYNGVPAGFPHCNEGHPCSGATAAPGTALGECLAVHAEVNLLTQCRDVWEIWTVYSTTSPCFECAKALLSTSCARIVFIDEYPHPRAREIWQDVALRDWLKFPS